MVTVGELVAGRYELEEVIGVGGMSRVFRARDRELERTVAIKMLSESMADNAESVERFQREARTAAGLTHENIVTVIDRGDDDGRSFIVLEYAPGTTLKQIVRANGALPARRALEIALQVAYGLAFAHSRGYIHRDVKPQNILVNGAGHVKLTDFGIARPLETTDDAFTHTGTVLGSADYIPPEQAQARPVDERTDIYSLGAVLYELLTGEPPFSGESFVAVAMKHINEPVPAVREKRPDVPPRVDAAVRRALAKRPEHRFPTMKAFAAELEECLRELRDDEPSEPTQILPPPPPASRPRSRRAMAATIALLVAAGVVAALFVPASKHAGAPQAGVQKAAAAVTLPARLRAVAAYDPPPGDGVEDNSRLPLATDGNPSTSWATEWYASTRFGNLKSGVGIVLDAGRRVELRAIVVRSDTPGFTCVVKTGSAVTGPFRTVSAPQTVERETKLLLRSPGSGRYYLLWITSLSPATGPHYRVDINGVTAQAASRRG